ncbi:MAG: ABC transporter substrate-binding protein [Flavobacteriales bacterium MED-G22]|nr:MAG: ABC transporter substrate-binding protein [Flavobacteriales bacterium MED-G22]
MNLSREIKTAILVLLGAAAFIFGFNYLKGTSIFDNDKNLFAIYEDVEGLVVGAKVTINGMDVGKVTKIDILPDFSGVRVDLSLRGGIDISRESDALLYESGLIGGKAISIVPSETGSLAEEGDQLPSKIKPGLTELINQQIAPLQSKIENMLTSADSLFAGVSNVMNYETQDNLKTLLKNLTTTIESINDISSRMVTVVDDNQAALKATLKNVEGTTSNLEKMTDSLAAIRWGETAKEIQFLVTNLTAITQPIAEGEGTIGQLIKNDSLYYHVNASTEALEALLKDLKAHPKRYVHFSLFGRKEKPTNE